MLNTQVFLIKEKNRYQKAMFFIAKKNGKQNLRNWCKSALMRGARIRTLIRVQLNL